jgi:hypothetical protein
MPRRGPQAAWCANSRPSCALRQRQSAQAAVLRNTELTPAQKLVALATINEAGWRQSAGGVAPYQVNEGKVAAAAGVTPQAVSSSYKALCGEGGVFAKDVTRDYDPQHGWYSTVRLTPRAPVGVVDLLKAIAACTPERPEETARQASAPVPRAPARRRRETLPAGVHGRRPGPRRIDHYPEIKILNSNVEWPLEQWIFGFSR